MTAVQKSMIAVVDDDFRVLEAMEELLESAGHSACLFSSAQSLLENDVLRKIDCLITDIGMPVVDGFELHRLARAVRPELPVIFITARHDLMDQRRAPVGGHQGFFRKPFDAPALLSAISRAVSTS
ncbi:response regulator [Rhizobium sp. BK251]|uniref:response regulator transcription factor n=1 Tax=Rhizobium sp. BK251 TaxID=2512125 RepID=UPI001049E3FB|nr:response regulator [Rhizobium sp. BK251]TCL68077.1 response regulator receiver domain-containing protein [Rhizobium sp. BK251]